MAAEVRSFQVTIPAGTLPDAGWSQAMAFPSREVVAVNFLIPPGPRGVMGFALGSGGQPMFPFEQGTWIVTDNRDVTWSLEETIDSGAWELFGYNTGTYDHTVYVTFQLNPVPQVQAGALTPLTVTPD